jgi:hypothetical protein
VPWLPVALVLAVPLVYEAAPREPTYTWGTFGLPLAAVLVAGGVLSRFGASSKSRATAMSRAAVGIVVIAACSLYLTATPLRPDPYLDLGLDPTPSYSTALGTSGAKPLDAYRVTTDIPGFVGNATYKNEQLLTWIPRSQFGTLLSIIGMYHSGFDELPTSPPDVTRNVVGMLDSRKPAELLILDTHYVDPSAALNALSRFQPVLLRAATLRSGSFVLYVWLINLKVFGPAS